MTLELRDAETDRLAQEVASLTGETIADAVRTALAERLERERKRRDLEDLVARIHAVAEDFARLPDLDTRSPDEILGYDEHGAW